MSGHGTGSTRPTRSPRVLAPHTAGGRSGDPGRAVAVLGLGASGEAAARLALAKGASVYVSDTRADASTSSRGADLRSLGARVDLGTHDVDRIAGADTVVVSPGIPPDAPVLVELRGRGVRWISEPEFAVRFLQGALIAVTGTNGKTTTSALAAHLLRTGGLDVALGGNIGAGLGPAASEIALLDPSPSWVVMEVSSFQLADIDTFKPDIGVVTNLAPDHLDRYPSVERYYADKARIFDNADAGSRWVLNGDDPAVLSLPGGAPGERYLFTLRGTAPAGAATETYGATAGWGFVRGGVLTVRIGDDEEPLVSWSEVPLLGIHNQANALAAALVARLAGVEPERLAEGLRTAQPLPHRLEPVTEADGVLWVDDSKATNVAAAVSAVKSLRHRPLVLLLGGKDKGEDLGALVEALVGRTRAVLTYGAAGPRMAAALEGAGVDGVERFGGEPEDFRRVVRRAARAARPGDAVLLAPACSSFDMFENYEERGERFRALALEVAGAPGDPGVSGDAGAGEGR